MIKDKKNIIKIAVILIVICILIFAYVNISIYINKKRINKYIKDNKYVLENYYIYTLTTENNNTKIIQKLLYDNYYFTKNVIEDKDDGNLRISYYYTKDKEIIIEYENSYVTDNDEYKMDAVKATYKNNKLLDCEKILGNISCESLNAYATNYENEIKAIISSNKLNLYFLDKVKLDTTDNK